MPDLLELSYNKYFEIIFTHHALGHFSRHNQCIELLISEI